MSDIEINRKKYHIQFHMNINVEELPATPDNILRIREKILKKPLPSQIQIPVDTNAKYLQSQENLNCFLTKSKKTIIIKDIDGKFYKEVQYHD